jgi:RecA/RadA recombinase
MSFADALAKASLSNYEKQSAMAFRSTGYPPLDAALSGLYKQGGFADGRIVEIFGPSSAGKTVIATYVMASAQKAGGLAGFHDHERTFQKKLAQVMCGLSVSPDCFVYDQPWTFEQSIDRMREKVLIARGMEFNEATGEYGRKKGAQVYFDMDKPIVWVFDSLHSMVPMSAAGKGATDRNMNDNTALARATSSHFPALAMFAEATNTLIIFLNQIRLVMGSNPKYPQYKSTGGDAPEYYASQRLRLTRQLLKNGTQEIGQKVTCKVIKNKVYRPNLVVEWDFMYQPDGTGAFDTIGGVLDRLIDLKKLEQSGAWVTWTDGKKYPKGTLKKKLADEGLLQTLIDMLPDQLAEGEAGSEEQTEPEEAGVVSGFGAAAATVE